jgi:hypothetical protein
VSVQASAKLRQLNIPVYDTSKRSVAFRRCDNIIKNVGYIYYISILMELLSMMGFRRLRLMKR